jgi:hypothetical protein
MNWKFRLPQAIAPGVSLTPTRANRVAVAAVASHKKIAPEAKGNANPAWGDLPCRQNLIPNHVHRVRFITSH